MKIIFCSGTKILGLAQYFKSVFGLAQKFGPAQNILEPVIGQGINENNDNFFRSGNG